MDTKKDEKEFSNKCFKMVREVSFDNLSKLTKMDSLRVEDFELNGDLSYDHWIASITVLLGPAKIHTKAHFDSRAARELAALASGKPGKGLPVAIMMDFMKEFLNMCMGDLKHTFSSKVEEVSIPQVEPTYDQATNVDKENEAITRYWKISWGNQSIILGCFIHVTGELKELEETSGNPNVGKVEFL